MPSLTPQKKDACMKDLAQWFAEHRKYMDLEAIRPIMRKHFSGTELGEFTAFIDSPEGEEQFSKRLRLEAWKAVRPEKEGLWLVAGAEEKFPLGQIVMTRGVSDLATENTDFAKFAAESLRRHTHGDWGSLDEEDKKQNEYALGKHLRLLSAYEKYPLPKIWIITEADRSVTTILFPEEY